MVGRGGWGWGWGQTPRVGFPSPHSQGLRHQTHGPLCGDSPTFLFLFFRKNIITLTLLYLFFYEIITLTLIFIFLFYANCLMQIVLITLTLFYLIFFEKFKVIIFPKKQIIIFKKLQKVCLKITKSKNTGISIIWYKKGVFLFIMKINIFLQIIDFKKKYRKNTSIPKSPLFFTQNMNFGKICLFSIISKKNSLFPKLLKKLGVRKK